MKVFRTPDFVVPFREPTNATALVYLLLDPVDAHILSARQLPFKSVRCATGAEHDSRTSSLGVVDGAANGLRSGVHVYEQYLRLAGNHEVSVGGGHAHFFVETEDGLRDDLAAIDVLGEALLDRECVCS